MQKSIISTLALASLASFTLLYATSPAVAKKMTCQQKAMACESRCAKANAGDYGVCISRTCTKQYGTCGR